jgi:hypothetical protein
MLKDEYTKPKVFTLFHKFDLDKTKEMRKSLFEIYALLKGENKYGMKLVNFSTSIKADTTKQAYNKIFEDILPDQAKLKTEPKKEHLGTKILASKSKDAPEYDITMDIEKLTTLIMDDPDISRGFADQVITEVTLNGMETKTGHGSDNIDEYYNLKDKLKTISEIKNRGIGATIEIIDPLVQEFSNFLIGKAKNGTNLDIISKDEYTLIVNFVNTFVDMKSEFWHFIKEKQLKEYEIERRISKIFNELTTTLLDAVVINNIFDITHRAKINGVLSKLFS